jgi:rhodanese-related sulfurtransferase
VEILKKIIRASFLMGILFGLPGCGQEVKQRGLVVVNVLDKELFDDCHIAGSINIPLDELDQKMDSIARDADLVFYCSNYQCTGSGYAAAKFREKGFENVRVYEGGMAEWYQAGLPIEGDHLKAYLSKPSPKFTDEEESSLPIITMEQLAKKMNEVERSGA